MKKSGTKFGDLQKQVTAILEESKATYVYLVMPIKNVKAAVDGDLTGEFMLTIDGSNPPEDWGMTYHHEVQFSEAWNQQVAAARSAWADGENAWCWSAFAPIINSQGQVVTLLNVDFPATDVITKYPQWSRDDANWNGFTDVINGEIPEEISAKMDEVKAIVEKYAKQLSAK